MKIHLLSGFLGSGKTTAIAQAVHLLREQNMRTAVISNDQGAKLVDGHFFKTLGIPNREVMNGCFCCNYRDLDAGIDSLIKELKPDIIFAESVGSCTDIVATVLKPLLQFKSGTEVTLSVFADVRLLQMMLQGRAAFDEAVRYIYLKQLEEATIIVVNKTDLISREQLSAVKNLLLAKYKGKIFLYQDSLNLKDIQYWLNMLDAEEISAKISSLDINYDLYALGESKMGWLDQSVEIICPAGDATLHAEHLVNKIYQIVQAHRYPIGHLKFLVNDSVKISFTANEQAAIALPAGPAAKISLLINMRVEATPEQLVNVVADAAKEVQRLSGCNIVTKSQAAFQPGYPRPVYRV
jgi:G3E family GTPase